MMHENGHTFSLVHVNDESAVMNPYNTCTTNFRSQSRAQIKDYVQFYAGSPGCSCAGSTEPDPEPEPEPEPPVEPPTVQCQQLGKNDCRATSGCFRFRRTCWPTAENGAVCANISKKKLCRKTNCLWA